MKQKNNILFVLSILLMSLSTYGADPAKAKTIGRIISQRADLSNFLKVLEKSEVGSALSEKTNVKYTVFAPSNKAFKALTEQSIKTLLDPRNDDRLEEVFNFHLLNSSQPPFELEKYVSLKMVSGQFQSINYKNKSIGGASFTGEVIPCSNGVIYIIDKVLTPTTDDTFQVLQKDGRFKLFTKAITASRQGKLFQNVHRDYTVFAPTDKAFQKLPKEFIDSLFLPENDERLEDIIKHHITGTPYSLSKGFGTTRLGVPGITPISAFGQQLNFAKSGNGFSLDGINISQANIPSANGLIHVIDSVNPPSELSVLEIIVKDKRLSRLVKLLEVSGLNLPLADSSNYTIFAPVDEAWDQEVYKDLIANPTGKNKETIFAILSRHVITGKHISKNPIGYQKLRTIHGSPIYLTVDNKATKIQGNKIIESDKEAFNGLINIIGSVIEDPMELPEKDRTKIDGIRFARQALIDASKLYNQKLYEESWKLYARRGYELADKYGKFFNSSSLIRTIAESGDPFQEFADNAWLSRNAFLRALQKLESGEDKIEDLLQINGEPEFGR